MKHQTPNLSKMYLLEFHTSGVELKDLDTCERHSFRTIEGLIQALKEHLMQTAQKNQG
jgi:hypothetical protein